MTPNQAENHVCDRFNKEVPNAKFIMMDKNKFSGFDVGGKVKEQKVTVEVKYRRTPVDWGDTSGWILNDSKIRSVFKEIRYLKARPEDVVKIYATLWEEKTYLFDMDAKVGKKPKNHEMNGTTDFKGVRYKVKENKPSHYFYNEECLLQSNSIELKDLFLEQPNSTGCSEYKYITKD